MVNEFDKFVAQEFEKATPINQIVRLLRKKFGRGSRSAINRTAKKLGLQHPNKDNRLHGKIDIGSTLKGVKPMPTRKASPEELNALESHCKEHNLPFESRRLWWHKTSEFSVSFFDPKIEEDIKARQDAFLERISKKAPVTKRTPLPSDTLAVIASFDVHIGKHCERIRSGNDYTPDEAVRRVVEGQEALMKLTKPFGVTDVLLPMGNDIIHVDSNNKTTTGGTPQDTYGSVESQQFLATELYIRCINDLSKRFNVWLCHVNSNHDREKGWGVSQMVARYFQGSKNPRVQAASECIDNRTRKYFVFGDSLIMFHHGDMRKEEKLLGLIKAEANQALAQTNRVYVYQGDTHHKQVHKRGLLTEQTEKDMTGLTVIKSGNGAVNQMHVETVRSPSPADEWHNRSGYSNFPAVEVFLHDTHNQFARFTHWF